MSMTPPMRTMPQLSTPDAIRRALDEILPLVQKPARYTGGEVNSIVKDHQAVRPDGRLPVSVALIYPDVYDVGTSNLGIQILYEIVNGDPRFICERAYSPWVDMEAQLRRHGLPLFSLESKRPLRDFDVIGFSLAYELDYTNVLNVLDLAGIPLRAADRGPNAPLVIAGGSNTTNPEPMSDFIDLYLIGDGEESLPGLLELYDRLRPPLPLPMGEGRGEGRSRPNRAHLLREAAAIEGAYVPSFFTVTY